MSDSDVRLLERRAATGGQAERDRLRAALRRRGESPLAGDLRRLLIRGNARKRSRALGWDEVRGVLGEIVEPDAVRAWAFGGWPGLGPPQFFVSGTAVVIMAVREGEHVTIGVKAGAAPNVSPGRCWPALQPYAKTGDVRTASGRGVRVGEREFVERWGPVIFVGRGRNADSTVRWAAAETADRIVYHVDDVAHWLVWVESVHEGSRDSAPLFLGDEGA